MNQETTFLYDYITKHYDGGLYPLSNDEKALLLDGDPEAVKLVMKNLVLRLDQTDIESSIIYMFFDRVEWTNLARQLWLDSLTLDEV